MAIFSGPEIPNSGLVFNLDAANPKNYGLDAVEVLVVAGGGAGGIGESNINGGGGGGGGGGGVLNNSNFSVTPGTSYDITVGVGGVVGASSSVAGGNGQNSFIGRNLISNGTFSNTTGWTANGTGSTTFSAVGGRLSVSRNGSLGTGEPYTTITVESGVSYTLSIDVGGTPMGVNIGTTIGGAQFFGQNIPVGANNVRTFTATSSGTAYVLVTCDVSGTTSTIDNLFIGRSSTSIVSVGGGGGGGGDLETTPAAGTGGSGGGAGGDAPVSSTGTGTSGQGFNGGTKSSRRSAAGGGGSGGAGQDGWIATSNNMGLGGNGGPGAFFSISGTSTAYGGGGGGSGSQNFSSGTMYGGTGGVGGGGGAGHSSGGVSSTNAAGTNGTANTGGGGGGSYGPVSPGNGGSGIVIVRYAGPQRAIGGTVTRVGNDTVHTFTTVGSSTFTPISASNLVGISDLTGKHFLTNNGSVTYSSSNGGIAVFNGSNFFSIPNSADLNITSALTIEAWVVFSLDDSDFIFEKGDVNTQYSLFSHATDIVFRTYHAADGTYHTQNPSKNAVGVVNGQWVHIVATWDGTNKKIYINGVLKDTVAKSGVLVTTTKGASVGRFGGDTAGYYFNGNISKVAVYNRGLSSNEVLSCFNASRDRYGI